MRRIFQFLLFLSISGCAQEKTKVDGWKEPEEIPSVYFTIRGKVWASGGDLPGVLEANHIPVPDALVAVFREKPEPLPGRYYCNTCVDLPPGTLHTRSEVDGSFEMQIRPNTQYWLVVQKGDFRRVTEFRSGGSGKSRDFEESRKGVRHSMVTLPAENNPEKGMFIPRILIIKGRGEPHMHVFWEALGFRLGVDVDEIPDREAEWVVSSLQMLRNYSIILATCGDEAHYLKKPEIQENLREWIRGGGKLFIDDFAYDWAEQLFPSVLSFRVDYTLDYETGVCGAGTFPPQEIGRCVNYECYNASGIPEDDQLAEWIDHIHPYDFIEMRYGCNVIHQLGIGEQGFCENGSDPRCIQGILYSTPKIWMNGNTIRYREKPLTVSWNYYCGRVMYTVLHTHAEGSDSTGYELLLQEKIMLYLFMELQTCSTINLVE